MIKINLAPERRVLRQFAWFAVVGLPVLAALVVKLVNGWPWSRAELWTHPAVLATAGAAVVALVLFELGVPALTKAFFVALSLVAIPIGFVLSHALMMVVYYLVLTPIGLVFRMIGRDVIGMRPDPARSSYWHERPGRRPAASYFKLY